MKTSRLKKIGDALSQLANVLLLPRHQDTTPNESISGRAHRCGWRRTERFIDWLFSPFESRHCRAAYLADVERARVLLREHEEGRAA